MTEGAAEPAVVVHGEELSCAQLLIRLSKAVRLLPVGSVVHLETSDPVAPIDLPAWCRLTGHKYLGIVQASQDAAPRYALLVAAEPRPTRADRPWHSV